LLIGDIVYFEWSIGAAVAMLSGIFLLAVATPVAGVLYYRSALRSFVPEIANKNRQRAEEQAKKILRDTTLPNLIAINRALRHQAWVDLAALRSGEFVT
jgi:hypothetical protein